MRGLRGPKSTVPLSAIPGGSVAAERSYRTSGGLTPVSPVLGGGGGGGLRDWGPMLALCPFFL